MIEFEHVKLVIINIYYYIYINQYIIYHLYVLAFILIPHKLNNPINKRTNIVLLIAINSDPEFID